MRLLAALATKKAAVRSWMNCLLLTNGLLVSISWVYGQLGMVRLALVEAHMAIAALFILSFIFLVPLTLTRVFSLRAALAYWIVLSHVLITMTWHFVLIFVVIFGIYAALYLYLRYENNKQGADYPVAEFIEIPLQLIVIYAGVRHFLDPGGPTHYFYVQHVVFSLILVLLILLRWARSRGRRHAFLHGSRKASYAFYAFPFAVAGIALCVGHWKATLYGEMRPPKEIETITLSADELPSAHTLIRGPASLVIRPSCRTSGCHDDIFRQWDISPHRYSVNNRLFQKVREEFMGDFGRDAALVCDRCHDPVGLVLGPTSGPESMEEGINCVFCHSIKNADEQNGSITYEFRLAYNYPTRNLEKARRDYDRLVNVTKFAHYREWSKTRPVWRGCIACHRVVLPQEYARGRSIVLGDMLTPWLHSSSSQKQTDCINCHCPLRSDTAAQEHARPDHVMLGTNQAVEVTRVHRIPNDEGLPYLRTLFDEVWFPGKLFTVKWYMTAVRQFSLLFLGGKKITETELLYKDTPLARAVVWLAGHDLSFDYMFNHPVLGVELETNTPVRGQRLEIAIRTKNLTMAHRIPSGPLDLNEVWLEVLVKDASGRTVFHSGKVDPRHRVDPDARRLGATVVDQAGVPIADHRFWEAARLVQPRLLDPDSQVEDRFEIPLPPDVGGTLTIDARWLYRRYNQEIADWIFDKDGTTLPISVFGSAHKVLEVAPCTKN